MYALLLAALVFAGCREPTPTSDASAQVLSPSAAPEVEIAGCQATRREPLTCSLRTNETRLNLWIAAREAPTVLTPHAGELGRLLGRDSGEVGAHRLASVREAARAAGAIVVLKGDDTIVSDGERVAVNAIAAPALATAGSGDVLSGILAALLARGLDPFAAACAAVVAHARAGRDAATRIGAAESVIASDVIGSIPAGLRPGQSVE